MAAWTGEDVRNLRIADVTDDELATIREVLERWRAGRGKDVKRSLYYVTERSLKDLGIALPPQLQRAKTVLGWAAQAVRTPAVRTQVAALRLPGADDPFELDEIFVRNA